LRQHAKSLAAAHDKDALPFIDLTTVASDLLRLADSVETMSAWILGDCICPCCTEERECALNCSFAFDAPTAAERMAEARLVVSSCGVFNNNNAGPGEAE
jgi:hypothetical protein